LLFYIAEWLNFIIIVQLLIRNELILKNKDYEKSSN